MVQLHNLHKFWRFWGKQQYIFQSKYTQNKKTPLAWHTENKKSIKKAKKKRNKTHGYIFMQLTWLWLWLLKCCYGYKYSAFVFHHFRNERIQHTQHTYPGRNMMAFKLHEFYMNTNYNWLIICFLLNPIPHPRFSFPSTLSSHFSSFKLRTHTPVWHAYTYLYNAYTHMHPRMHSPSRSCFSNTVAATNKFRLRMRLFNIINSDTTFTSSSRLFSVSIYFSVLFYSLSIHLFGLDSICFGT